MAFSQVLYYKCDPGKAIKCPKKSCYYNPNSELQECRMTTNKSHSSFPNEPYSWDDVSKTFIPFSRITTY